MLTTNYVTFFICVLLPNIVCASETFPKRDTDKSRPRPISLRDFNQMVPLPNLWATQGGDALTRELPEDGRIAPPNSPRGSEDEMNVHNGVDIGSMIYSNQTVSVTKSISPGDRAYMANNLPIVYRADQDPLTMEPFSHTLGKISFYVPENGIKIPRIPFPWDHSKIPDRDIRIANTPSGISDFNDVRGVYPSFPFPPDRRLFEIARNLGLMERVVRKIRDKDIICLVLPPPNVIRFINLKLWAVRPDLFVRHVPDYSMPNMRSQEGGVTILRRGQAC